MKKRIITGAVIISGLLSAWFSGCRKDTISPGTERPISFETPAGWPQPAYNFAGNTLTQEGFELGRKLFYDMRLSRDSSVSCGSCHQQFSAFANLSHALSHGVEGRLGNRNTPGLSNMAWHTSYFWDGGVNNLEVQPINPIQNPVEMDLPLDEAVERLKSDANYRQRFEKAFGSGEITSQRMLKALAQFMGTMISAESRYDKHERGAAGGVFSASEERGLQLFRQHCATCHKEPLFSDFSFRNNGVPVTAANDSGRAHITKLANDLYKFKVPSLRDVGVTAPYMHDGRFNTLEEVVNHYSGNMHNSPIVDPALKGGIPLTATDKKDIVNFLKTLTDSTFIKDKRFADPGK